MNTNEQQIGTDDKYPGFYRMDFEDTEKLSIKFRSGDIKLVGHLFKNKNARATVLLVHGYLVHSGQSSRLIEYLLKEDFNVGCFDLPGHGFSQGGRGSAKNIEEYSSALGCFIDEIKKYLSGPFHLIGHSLGAGACIDLMMSGGREDIEKIVLAAPMVRFKKWNHVKYSIRLCRPFVKQFKRCPTNNTSDKAYIDAVKKDSLQIRYIPLSWIDAVFDWNRKIEKMPPVNRQIKIIQGDSDHTVDWKYNLKFLSEKFADCRIDIVRSAQHEILNESEPLRNEVFSLISNYLKQPLKTTTTENTSPYRSLGMRFISAARANWKKDFISDCGGRNLSCGKAFVAAEALCRIIHRESKGQSRIGILLPPCVPAVLANFAVTLSGRTSVNLNYVLNDDAIVSAVNQCGLKTIISSRGFAGRFENKAITEKIIYIEDLFKKISLSSKTVAYLRARFIPEKFLAKRIGPGGDKPATILFSSGSSGTPKGVVLSHNNILSNIEQMINIFRLEPDDHLCGVLPFFHSFGFTCSLWLPAINAIGAGFIANPLDTKAVGRMTNKNNSTILFAVPTFLASYIKRIEPSDFTDLRAVVVGAEKLKGQLADSFENKFAVRPFEGYGITELSPAVSFNLPGELSHDWYKYDGKKNTVGRPLPGTKIKVIEPDTGRLVGCGEKGVLFVSGPSVMLGYLNDHEQTTKVLKDGWYNTGDIVKLDQDGFITIVDRLSRFSKIGGEMVGHMAIEQAYTNQLDPSERVVAVTSVPNIKKGEELIVLYTDKAPDPEKLHKIISKSKLPNIFKPRKNNYIKVESIPLLGSGKLDVQALRKLAVELQNQR